MNTMVAFTIPPFLDTYLLLMISLSHNFSNVFQTAKKLRVAVGSPGEISVDLMAEAVDPGLLEEAATAGDSDLQVRVRCVGRHDRVSWGSTSIIGRRREMEDALIVVAGFMSRACHQVGGCAAPGSGSSDEIYPVHFFAVYDGHGSSEDTVVKNEAKVSQEDVDLPKASTSVPRNQRRSADNSPLHPHNYQAKLGAKGINGVLAGSSEGNHGLAPLTPVRSRTKSTPRGNETPDMVASVPKFGEWDASDPSSADGYTGIFNQVRAERQGGAGSTPSISANGHNLSKNNSSKGCCCCFPWGGK